METIDICGCNLGDEGFSKVLDAVKGFRNLRRICYQNDTFLDKSSLKLVDLLNPDTSYPKIKMLELLDLKTSSSCMAAVLKMLKESTSIRVLRLKSINLSNQKVFNELLEVVSNVSELCKLDLCDTRLTTY